MFGDIIQIGLSWALLEFIALHIKMMLKTKMSAFKKLSLFQFSKQTFLHSF